MVGQMTALPLFADHYPRLAPTLPGADLAWVERLRTDGLERYRRLGLPGPRVEAWKYTNLNPLAKIDFAPAVNGEATPATVALPTGRTLAVQGTRLVVVNGRFRPDLSALDELPDGVVAGGLAEALARDPAAIEANLGRIATVDGMPMLALNTALMADGIVLRIAEGVTVDRPIHLIFVGAAGDAPLAVHPRILVIAGRDSRATLVESHVGVGDRPYLSNLVSEVALHEGAALGHYKLQNEQPAAFHLAATQVRLDSRSTYDGFVLSLGARLSRSEIRAHLGGGEIECRLSGAYAVAGEQHVDNTTFIDHAAPGSRSREVYKGVLDDTARGVFQGKILVRPQAQKTDGYQLNRGLLLSRGAELDSKPELEIYADDVKCSHGAAIGEIDQDQLFYLRARGIDPATARDILVEAFLNEVLDEIRFEPARDGFRAILAGWLAGRRETAAKG
jgi:Fe-S cluster assembly protein SufD